MNNQIKELLLKVVPRAGEDGDYLPSLHTPRDIEQFAELIIRECCSIVNYRTQHNNPHDCLTVLDIKEHFGVEE